jgi:hypothetical protein
MNGRWRGAALLLMAVAAGCGRVTPEEARGEPARFRKSVERFRAEYVESVEAGNRLTQETIVWLNGPAVTEPRSHAVAGASRLMDRWAKVYFVPRHMHEQLRYDEYSREDVRRVQKRMLDGLRREYFEYHDYQRYAQGAAESSMHQTPQGRLAAQLVEFRQRLETRAESKDWLTPLVETLP